MKKKLLAILVCAASATMLVALTACGANLDREVTVQNMTLSVPSNWAEEPNDSNTDNKGSVWFEDVDVDKDENDFDAIYVSYQKVDTSDTSTTKQAIEAKQEKYESDFGITNWDIDDETEQVIDGAKVTIYEYSFKKAIDNVTQKYEYKIAYVYAPSMHYTIQVYGDAASINDVINSIEL